MRVLTFLHSFEPGGVERDALRLNDEWARLGVDVQIALGRRDGRLADEAPDLPYSVFQKGRFSTARFETLWMILRLPAAIRRLKPDILFCAGNTYSIVAVAMRLILGSRCPPIVLRVSNDLRRHDLPVIARWFYGRWLKLQAPAFSQVVAMAAPLAQEVIDEMHMPAERLNVINNGSIRRSEAQALAQARDSATRDPAKGRKFLAVGRLVAQKNFALLLDAFALIAKPADTLTIVGAGSEAANIRKQAERLHILAQLEMPGHVNPLDQYFAHVDAYVLSSNYEGLPAVLIEALAAGVPIVATDCCASISLLIEDAGRIVPPNNVSVLANAMDHIADDKYDPAIARARAARFTVEATAPAWIRLFESLRSSC
jgi:glycosyltransferase involved in cell wall biosynthesis